MEKNIYIHAMEIGYKHPNGISYFDLKQKVEEEAKLTLEKDAEWTFFKWVAEHFDNERMGSVHSGSDLFRYIKMYMFGHANSEISTSSARIELNRPLFIKGITLKYYYDYIELSRARKNSALATIFSILSILVAVGAIWSSNQNNHAPPYEVKVIENKAQYKELKMEVDSLKNEIYEANLIIDAYEDDSILAKNRE